MRTENEIRDELRRLEARLEADDCRVKNRKIRTG